MKASQNRKTEHEVEPVRVLGRGLRARKGVHLPIRVVREAAGKTQLDVAEAAGINQGDVSRLERRVDFDECQVATLRRCVEALGGTLDLVAVFGTKRITLSGK